jgi:type VI secretion system protein ImpL
MKQIFLKILKAFLIVATVLLGLLLVFGVVLILDWPWWVGFFVLLGLLGLGLGLLYFRKMWLRRREQYFVQEIIEQDDSYLKAMGDKDRERSKELQDRWKEAMDALRHSHLRKYGNPLYVLPWYVVIGESGSGKTTAIKSARLSSPFADVSRISGISGTRNCDWWFFEQAILIDTAGRYAIPIDEGRDKDEWQKFLTLLAKYRKKEPLNGLVVTVPASKLVESGFEALEEDGRSIRRRIDELMRVLGTKFPVYVLVTKCDLIQGMTQFCDSLPEKSLDQAMGLINHDLSKDVTAFHTRAIGVIADRLRDLRLLLFHQSDSSRNIDPGLLLFPEEFERMKSGLQAFIKGAFQENPYQETPLLRGLFFSSGRQEGSPYSHFLNALGLIQERDVLPGTNKGLFLHDFFGRILPKDRKLFAPTQRAIEWSRLTRNLGLTAWVAVAVAVCGLLSFSFVKNLRTLRVVSREFAKPPVLQGEVVSDVVIMDHFQQTIVNVEEQNRGWWIPRFGLNESKDVEVRLKDKYCGQFKGSFLVPFDKQMAKGMTHFSSATADVVLGEHVAHLARRINLLRARLEGESLEMLYAKPQPSYAPIVSMADQKLIPEIREKFANLYLSYLVWRSDEPSLNQEMNELQTWLKHVLTLKGANLNWIVTWVDGEGNAGSVSLQDFWGGSLQASQEITVPPAFTLEGKGQVEAFVKEIESALVDPLIIASQKLEFQGWYRKAYLDAWYVFAEGFPAGAERLQGREERQQLAARMATGEDPYFSLLDRMTTELEPVAADQDLPTWIELVYEFKATKIKAAQEAALRDKGALAKATKKGKTLITKLEKKLSKLDREKAMDSQLRAARAFEEYQGALAQMTPVAASRAVAYETAAQVYKEDPATSKSPFIVAQNGLNKLKTYMASGKSGQKMFWKLVAGPLDYLWYFVRMETACHLQERWEKEVLVELQGLPDQQSVNRLLLGEEGYATKFVKGPAEPFVSRGLKKGYYAKRALDESIPLDTSFLSFLTKGARSARPVQASYSVSIRGLPTDTNKGAKLRAHATRLELQCADQSTTLVNLNYPVSKTFDWSPQDCGDVIFEIEVGKLVLTKKYTGYQGFPRFLKDFGTGQRTFYPGHFPNEEAALKRLGIKHIKAKYRFKGHKPVLKLLGTAPGRVPRNIVTCWDQ